MAARVMGNSAAMNTARTLVDAGRTSPDRAVDRTAHGAALAGLAARGLLYLLLALVAVELVVGNSSHEADTEGALHRLSGDAVGSVVLVILAIGLAGFALWHVVLALGDRYRHDASRAAGDLGRAVVYGLLCALAISFLTAGSRAGGAGGEQTQRTWTATVLHWSIGPLLVVIVGLGVVAVGGYLVWRAFTGRPQDEPAVLDAAPRETPTLHVLGAVGNVARGAVVAFIGVFLVVAAVQNDPNDTVGLDGALKELLDEPLGGVLVVLVAAGFLAFGVYSIARAWANRQAAAG
jgi:hypothetical protein